MGKLRGHDETQNEGFSKGPMFCISIVAFIGLLTILTRSHPNTAASGDRPAGVQTIVRDRGGGGATKAGGDDVDDEDEMNDMPPVAKVEGHEKTDAQEQFANEHFKEHLAAGKKSFADLTKMLTDYYKKMDGDKAMLDAFQYPFDRKSPEIVFIAEKIARAIQHGLPLTVGMIGSSVAAGHDNCAYDSFENQLERTMKDAFAAVGVNFTVRNAGQGGECGDTFANQIFCLRQLVGDDVDFTIYTWTYFEAGQQGLDNIHEAFIRWSLLMDRSPAPMLMYAETVKQGGSDLHDRYAKFGYNVLGLAMGVGKHGYKKPKEFWGAKGDGVHTATRYGEKEASQVRKDSLGVMYRNWHPGPLAFQAGADAYAYRLLIAAQEAIVMLEKGGNFPVTPKITTGSMLGPSKCTDTAAKPGNRYWRKSFCDVEEPPNCIDHELPVHGNHQVSYASATDDLNPMFDVFTKQLTEKKNDPSKLIPREERDMPECQHSDFCRGYRADFMTYRLPRMETGFVLMCCVKWGNCGETLVNAQFFMDKVPLTNVIVASGFGKEKCVMVQETLGPAQATGGHYYLSVNLTDVTFKDVYISHVIAG